MWFECGCRLQCNSVSVSLIKFSLSNCFDWGGKRELIETNNYLSFLCLALHAASLHGGLHANALTPETSSEWSLEFMWIWPAISVGEKNFILFYSLSLSRLFMLFKCGILKVCCEFYEMLMHSISLNEKRQLILCETTSAKYLKTPGQILLEKMIIFSKFNAMTKVNDISYLSPHFNRAHYLISINLKVVR